MLSEEIWGAIFLKLHVARFGYCYTGTGFGSFSSSKGSLLTWNRSIKLKYNN